MDCGAARSKCSRKGVASRVRLPPKIRLASRGRSDLLIFGVEDEQNGKFELYGSKSEGEYKQWLPDTHCNSTSCNTRSVLPERHPT